MRWFGRREVSGAAAGGAAARTSTSPAVASAPVRRREGDTGERPTPARLLSERGRRLVEPAGGNVAAWYAATTYAEQLDERTRGRLAMAVETHVPHRVAGAAQFGPEELMARLALDRVVAARGDLSLRPSGPYDPSWFQARGPGRPSPPAAGRPAVFACARSEDVRSCPCRAAADERVRSRRRDHSLRPGRRHRGPRTARRAAPLSGNTSPNNVFDSTPQRACGYSVDSCAFDGSGNSVTRGVVVGARPSVRAPCRSLASRRPAASTPSLHALPCRSPWPRV